jgi:Protein of unknown function (DUF3800)
MKYNLFLDESGDHGLAKLNPDFPVFLLCGILIKENNYELIRQSMNQLKSTIWGGKDVIFHSRDIRKCEKEFQKLFDLDLKKKFYEELNKIIAESSYIIIASAIQKQVFVEKVGKVEADVYEIALSFLIEQAIKVLEDIPEAGTLSIIIERRGKKEDKQLEGHFQRIVENGTDELTTEAISRFSPSFTFRNKKENINGLQLADLIAYPIARNVIEPNRSNPAYDVLEGKIYRKGGHLQGLRIFP